MKKESAKTITPITPTLDTSENDGPYLGQRELTMWGGTRQNTALAECAEVENRSGDTIASHMSALTLSPMFKLLVDDFKAERDPELGFEPDFYLVQFAARLFYAGVIAGRKEVGQRDVMGDLILDAQWRPEMAGVVHPLPTGGAK